MEVEEEATSSTWIRVGEMEVEEEAGGNGAVRLRRPICKCKSDGGRAPLVDPARGGRDPRPRGGRRRGRRSVPPPSLDAWSPPPPPRGFSPPETSGSTSGATSCPRPHPPADLSFGTRSTCSRTTCTSPGLRSAGPASTRSETAAGRRCSMLRANRWGDGPRIGHAVRVDPRRGYGSGTNGVFVDGGGGVGRMTSANLHKISKFCLDTSALKF